MAEDTSAASGFSKIDIAVGPISVRYEGPVSFLEKLPELLEELKKIADSMEKPKAQ